MLAVNTIEFLEELPAEDRARLAMCLHREVLTQGETLYETGRPVTHVYIPLTAEVEERLPLSDGHWEPLGRIGRGEFVGGAMLADPVATRTALVIQSGDAWCMSYADFAGLIEASSPFRSWVMQQALRTSLINLHKFTEA